MRTSHQAPTQSATSYTSEPTTQAASAAHNKASARARLVRSKKLNWSWWLTCRTTVSPLTVQSLANQPASKPTFEANICCRIEDAQLLLAQGWIAVTARLAVRFYSDPTLPVRATGGVGAHKGQRASRFRERYHTALARPKLLV